MLICSLWLGDGCCYFVIVATGVCLLCAVLVSLCSFGFDCGFWL